MSNVEAAPHQHSRTQDDETVYVYYVYTSALKMGRLMLTQKRYFHGF